MGAGPLGFDHLSAFSSRSLWYLQSATRRLDYYCGSRLDGLTGTGAGQVDGKARMVWEVDLSQMLLATILRDLLWIFHDEQGEATS